MLALDIWQPKNVSETLRMGSGGLDQEATDDEALYGREYLDWKKQTLGAQVDRESETSKKK